MAHTIRATTPLPRVESAMRQSRNRSRAHLRRLRDLGDPATVPATNPETEAKMREAFAADR